MTSNSPRLGQTSGASPQVSHAAVEKGQTSALLQLLQLEADIRHIETTRELVFHLANESRAVLGFRQAFVFRHVRKWRLAAVSSVSTFDKHAPLNREMQQFVSSLGSEFSGSTAHRIDLTRVGGTKTLRDYAFPHALWIPIRNRRGFPFAGLLLLREEPWPTNVLPLTERVARTYGHAWEALAGRKLDRSLFIPRSALMTLAFFAALAVGLIKAPLAVLAPAEVTGRDRIAVAAPMNGVIQDVLVVPNSLVEEGAVLARYDDTELRNALEISNREVIVARARLEKLQNASFSDRTAAREVKIAEAELALAQAELTLAQDRLSRVDIRAPQAGLLVFESVRDLIGRPVSVGERAMEIIDPTNLEFTIRLPVNDSIVLQDGGMVRIFLDSSPLTPVEATLARRSYRATVQDDGSFAYTLTARVAPDDVASVRLGAHGTAQLFGDRHTLFFIVFRRPLSWIRQTFGF